MTVSETYSLKKVKKIPTDKSNGKVGLQEVLKMNCQVPNLKMCCSIIITPFIVKIILSGYLSLVAKRIALNQDAFTWVLLLLLLSRFSRVQLCDPIDSSPPGSPIPGILQARTLEWVAISFSNARKWKVKGKLLSRVQLLATPWTAAYQAPPSMGFARQEYWSGVPLPYEF